MLSTTIGIIYLWFGALKLFPGLSPAESLGANTISLISFDFISAEAGRIILAIIEVAVGIGLTFNIKQSIFVKMALGHMICTFIPLFAFPDLSFSHAPFGITIVGQYIMKNLIIIVALLLLLPNQNKNVRQTF